MSHAQQICQPRPVGGASMRLSPPELLALFNEWRRRARGRRELAVLCDRCLRDIGVTRYDADHEARKPFWRA